MNGNVLWLTGNNRTKGNEIATASSVNREITDAGMHHLTALTSPEYLNVANTDITKKGISILSQLSSLQGLDISGTKITEEGIRKLQAALPDCQIINEPGTTSR